MHANTGGHTETETPRVVILTGPTGSGKSGFSLDLARQMKTPGIEIISADSRQIYRGMDIGTDKVDRDVRAEIPHHMLDIIEPDRRYSAADFARDAGRIITEITRRGHLPLVVGGTGLYIRALTGGLAPDTGSDPRRRRCYEEQLAVHGSDHLYAQLRRRDPDRARQIQPADAFRIIRALELLDTGMSSIQDAFDAHGFKRNPYHTLKIILTVERSKLYKRIDQRVDQMIRRGLAEEVRRLVKQYGTAAPALDAIGYRQMIMYLNGSLPQEEAIRIIKRDSRRYAKRQLTWFRREPDAEWLEVDPNRPGDTLHVLKMRVRRFYEDGANGT